MPGLNANRGAKRAREARRDLGLGDDGPIGDILKVIEGRSEARVLLLDLPQDLAGAYIKRPALPLLIVRGKDFVGRQRFTLAHEFGHFRMDHETVVDKAENIGGSPTDAHEKMANAFAAEFLVPKKAMQIWGGGRLRRKVTLEDVVTLACEYGVSAYVIRYQLQTCGVLRDEALAKRLDGELEEGLHSQLATSLGLKGPKDSLAAERESLPRIPEAIAKSRLAELLTGRSDVATVAARMRITDERVEAMLKTMGVEQLLPSKH